MMTATLTNEMTREREGRGAVAPFVSIVIPCLNEERYIGTVLENLLPQYAAGRFEIIVVDGNSTDGTRAVISEFARRHQETTVRVIDNPKRDIPTALNLGMSAAQGDIIVRMDAHSVPSENYVRRCVAQLETKAAEVVGMPWRIAAGAETKTARAIALAVAHPFGIGDAKYRSEKAVTGFVDTVPFGAFRKSLWQSLNGFDETLLANEDYDFYYRARKDGARVLLDATEHCVYYARPTLGSLWTQYARYGNWKAQMLKRHPESWRVRQVVAPMFVVALVTSFIGGFVWRGAWMLGALVLATYLTGATLAAVQAARKTKNFGLVPHIVAAFLTIHLAWGGSFLIGLGRSPRAG